MKKATLLFILLLPLVLSGQNNDQKHKAYFKPGDGLTMVFNEGKYSFSLGGMIQPYAGYYGPEPGSGDLFLNSRRSFFSLKGLAVDEKVSFCIRTDFSQTQPLLDVYLTYQPTDGFSLSIGQKQNMANNRELLFIEDQLTFSDRSLLSTQYARSGREFGVFADYKINWGALVLHPAIAITSGDGRNSFGVDSRDSDLGGIKYGGRLDLYPFGEFSAGNEKMLADLAGESSPKVLIGVAASLNKGASDPLGEGHGGVQFYDDQGDPKFPDYRKLSADLLVKWKGISLLGELVINTAASLEGSFIDEFGNNALVPTQISEYLALGRGYHAQLGYCYKGSWGLDLSYAFTEPEFAFNPNSIIGDMAAYRLGLSHYLYGQNLKVMASATLIQSEQEDEHRAELMVQLRI
jgi:hypothetical protein